MSFSLAPVFRPGPSQSLSVPVSGSAPVSGNLAAGIGNYAVRLYATVDTYVTLGGTAAPATSMLLAAGFPEVFLCSGLTTISAVALGATAGTLNVTEVSR